MSAALLCLVVAISDGDTAKVRCGTPGAYEQKVIRLAEIDAPEKNQAHGQAAKQALSALCFQAMAKVSPVTTDRYGRTVARLECKGRDAGTELVRAGHVWVFDRYVTDTSLYKLQDAAKAARSGLWADSKAIPPWEWRHPAPEAPTAEPVAQPGPTCHTGPRGGHYTLTASGRKHYGC